MGRIVLVTGDPVVAQQLKGFLPAGQDGVVRQWPQDTGTDARRVARELAGAGADMVCIGHGVPLDNMLSLAEAFDRFHPMVAVVLLADADADLLERALRAGVRDVIPLAAPGAQFTVNISRAIDAAERRRSHITGPSEPKRRSQVITVLSPKGGSGKTMVATNLAVGLAVAAPGRVAIIDLDTQFGDVGALLSLDPKGTLGDVASSPVALDATLLKVLLTRRSPGLFALCAPNSPIEGDTITHEHTAAALALLAESFSTVVVDTAAGLDENTLAAVEVSTDLVLVCTTDVASVRSMRKELDALERLGMTDQNRIFVLNRCDARVGIEGDDIETVLGMSAAVRVPSAREVPASMNRGIPIIETEPRSTVSKALTQLVQLFAPGAAADAGTPNTSPATASWSSKARRWR